MAFPTNKITRSDNGADGYIAFYNESNRIAGDNDLYWDRVNNRLGIHTTTPNEVLTVDGTFSLAEQGEAPTQTSGFGKLYVSSADSSLHFLNDSGTDVNLTPGGSPVSATQGADGYLAFFTGSNTIAGDNDLFYDRVNSRLGINNTAPDTSLVVKGQTTLEGDPILSLSSAGEYQLVIRKSDLSAYHGIGVDSNNSFIIQSFTGASLRLNPIGNPILTGANLGINLSTSPLNSLDVNGGAVIGNAYAGVNVAPSNGLLVQGKVGIGTQSPDESLVVNGRISLQESLAGSATDGYGKLYVSELDRYLHYMNEIGEDRALATTFSGADGYLSFYTSANTIAGDNDLFWDRANNRLGIHTTSPNEVLTVDGTFSLAEQLAAPTQTSGFGKLYVSSADSDLHFIDGAGNDVNLTSAGTPVGASQGYDGYIAFFTGNNSIAGDNDLFWDRVNNRLGIHTITPTQALTIDGSLDFVGTSFQQIKFAGTNVFESDGSSVYLRPQLTSGQFYILSGTADSVKFSVQSSGVTYFDNSVVGVGTSNPQALLHVAGDGYFDGYLMPFTDNVHWLGTPDKRWKGVFTNGLHVVAATAETNTGVSRDWTIETDGYGDFSLKQGIDEKLKVTNSSIVFKSSSGQAAQLIDATTENFSIPIDYNDVLAADPDPDTIFFNQASVNAFLEQKGVTNLKHITNVYNALPTNIKHVVTFNLASGVHRPVTGGNGTNGSFSFLNKIVLNSGQVLLQGVTPSNYTSVSGPHTVTASQVASNNPYIDVTGTPFAGQDYKGLYLVINDTETYLIHDHTDSRLFVTRNISPTPTNGVTTFHIRRPATIIRNSLNDTTAVNATGVLFIDPTNLSDSLTANDHLTIKDIQIDNFGGARTFFMKGKFTATRVLTDYEYQRTNFSVSGTGRFFQIEGIGVPALTEVSARASDANQNTANLFAVGRGPRLLLTQCYFGNFNSGGFLRDYCRLDVDNCIFYKIGTTGTTLSIEGAVFRIRSSSGVLTAIKGGSTIGLSIIEGSQLAAGETGSTNMSIGNTSVAAINIGSRSWFEAGTAVTDGGSNTGYGVKFTGYQSGAKLTSGTTITGTSGDVLMADNTLLTYTEIAASGPYFDTALNLIAKV